MFKNPKPIEVIVSENRYDMYGDLTWAQSLQAKVLKNLGGINETVKPGVYTFRVRREGFKFITELFPKK